MTKLDDKLRLTADDDLHRALNNRPPLGYPTRHSDHRWDLYRLI